MPQYIIRNLPEPLWARVRTKATADQWPMRALILRLLEDYAEGRTAPSGTPPPQNNRED